MPEIFSAISCNLDEHILSTALPLFEADKIEAIEWSFDTLFKFRDIPHWFNGLLQAFGSEKRLIGHGVYFSLFSGGWSKEQQDWLTHLHKVTTAFTFDHISEHFGFMTGANFHEGAPISIPFTATTLAIGQDRLKRMAYACNCPVGLENLAFSYSLEEVKRHGEFLDQLVSPINGFIILDLHNVYCQCHNFNVAVDELLNYYPLKRVREMHISGGSWVDSNTSPGRKIRRDTHDDSVPAEVFELLTLCIPKCPNLKFVVLEQLSNGLDTALKKSAFRNDFSRMTSIVKRAGLACEISQNSFLPENPAKPGSPLQNQLLHAQQITLSNILETATSYENAKELLQASILANTEWKSETWEPHMLETAITIAQKWKYGFAG